jgi:hypothetical protein
MKISANSAIQSQLSTLPTRDQEHVTSVLSSFDPARASDHVRKIPNDNNLYEVRITSRLRALVRIRRDLDQVELLAVVRPDQIDRYVKVMRAV